MIRSMCAVMVGLFWLAGVAAAQPASANGSGNQPARSFEELSVRVRVGDTVRVVDASGRETTGRVATVSDATLTLTVDGTPRTFVPDAVKRIDRRRRDSVRNGLLIGAAGGGLLGYGLGRAADAPTCPRSGSECGQGALIGTVGGALWGAVGGWITDALIRKREIVYLAP